MKRWNGWGDEAKYFPVPDVAIEHLVSVLGAGENIEDISLEESLRSVSESRLPEHPLVIVDVEDRLRHACGQSLPDWINLRSGRIPRFPDGVVYPISDKEIRDVLDFARLHDLIVIPYGGGTSVVRHINPPSGESPTITVDLSRLNRLLDIDKTSQLATFEAGARGPEIEKQLNNHRYTLGHYPQSFEYSTLGGWIATRSSGQQSYHYGRIEDMFKGGHVETPQGSLDLPPFPASAAGPDLRQLILGSEGCFGIISRALIAVRLLPEYEAFYGIFFKDWESGIGAVREIAQKEIQLSMLRLNDPQETETTLLLSGKEKLTHWADIGLSSLGYRGQRCLLIFGTTGEKYQTMRNRKETVRICRHHGGLFTGKLIGSAWQKSRFLTPYLRNTLWDLGYALDTLETATTWSKVKILKDKIIEAISQSAIEQGEPILVFGHISHVYHTGASVYITYIFKRSIDPDENMERWRIIKSAASKEIIAHGGTISHQHGVGYDHAPYLQEEKGVLGLELLSSARKTLDPNGNMLKDVLIQEN
jgi:alkyldihydroxyacetonephosphate synthase